MLSKQYITITHTHKYKMYDSNLTLLLPDSNFKRRCVRHNILTSSIVDVLEQEKALFVLAATLVQYMPTI